MSRRWFDLLRTPPNAAQRRRRRGRAAGVSRRRFLRGLGGLAVGLPLLPSLLSRQVRAQDAPPGALTADGYPRRLVVFFHPNGVMPDAWWPQNPTSEREFELAASLSALAPYRDRMLMLHGVNLESAKAGPGGPHQKGMGTVLSGHMLQEGSFVGGDGSLAGWGDGITLDQVVANHVGTSTPLRSLELGVRADSGGGAEVRSRLSYAGPAQPLPPLNDPQLAFDVLFSDFETDPSMMSALRARRLSVLDTVGDQFATLQGRVGYEDRPRLDAHFEMVRDLERRLQLEDALGAECHIPTRPDALADDDEDTMPQITAFQIELLTLALVCDITRVVSIQFSNAINHIRYPWLGSLGDGHALSHAGPSDVDAHMQWVTRDQWLAEQMKTLLDTLDSVPEGSGTMLDNTVVLWINELSVGNTHSPDDMPFVMIGGGGGKLDVGRYLSVPDTPHNDLLAALARVYGVDVDLFGKLDFATGVMPGVLR